MIQQELDHILKFHQHWLSDKSCHEARADFTNLTLENFDITHKNLAGAIFKDSYFYKCDFSNSNLTDIMASGVHFMESNFTNATFKNAYLQQAKYTSATFSNTDLWNVTGDGVYIISLQLGGSSVCYTSELLQINCQQFDLEKIWWMTEDQIIADIDGYTDEEYANMRVWWTKWKYQIYQIVNLNPAKPVNSLK